METPFSTAYLHPYIHPPNRKDLETKYASALQQYQQGLNLLDRNIQKIRPSLLISWGFSAANMLDDLKTISNIQVPSLKILGSLANDLLSNEIQVAQQAYMHQGVSFNNSVLVEDFARSGSKLSDIYDQVVKRLKIKRFKVGLLAAAESSEFILNAEGINIFVANPDPSDELIELIRLRRSPFGII